MKVSFIFFMLLLFNLCLVAQAEQDLVSKNKKDNLKYGYYLLENNNLSEAEESFQNYIKSLKSFKERREAYYEIALKYNDKLYFDLSISYIQEGINDGENDAFLMKKMLQAVSINYIELGNYDLAEEYYSKSIKYETNDKSVYANDENLIGEICRLRGDLEESIKHFHIAIGINKTIAHDKALAVNYNNIGLSYLELDNLDSSAYYLNSSLQKIKATNLKIRKDAINISFGKLYIKRKEYQEALNFFEKSIKNDLSDNPDKIELYRDAYEGIWICQEHLGNFEEALFAYKKFQLFNGKILDYSKQAEIFQNQIMIERVAHVKEVNSLNEQLVLEQKYKKVLLVLLGGIFLLMALISYVLWLRNKSIKQKVELETNKNRIQDLELDKIKLSRDQLELELIQSEQEKKIKHLERLNLEKQIDSKNRELTSTAIHILNKNEILSDINDKISLMASNANEDLSKPFSQINNLIKDSLRLDNDWEIFKKHFTDVHPNFFTKLINEYPDLTTDELKLCAYLKIQLSSKEIARLINISVSAVNKRRNRMRKKLNISPEVDLYEFLIKISDS